jgi:hypothetical protein
MTLAIPQILLLVTFQTEPLAWFRVDEYSGLTGRKGTTVVSVTRVLWFCVASQTSQRKEPETESHHTWGATAPVGGTAHALLGRLGEAHSEANTRKSTCRHTHYEDSRNWASETLRLAACHCLLITEA